MKVECHKHGFYEQAAGCQWCEDSRDRAPTQPRLGFSRADVRSWLQGAMRLSESDLRWVVTEVYRGRAHYAESVYAGSLGTRWLATIFPADSTQWTVSADGNDPQVMRRAVAEKLIELMPEDV